MKLAVLGATGRTGVHVVRQAVAAGHEVRVLVRDRGRLPDVKVTVVEGTLNDESVRHVVAGADAVLSCLGPTPGDVTICSRAARAVVAAHAQGGPARFLSVSGGGVDVPGDNKDLQNRIVSRLVRLFGGAGVADKKRELSLLEQSALQWTLVRPPRLVDGKAQGRYRLRHQIGPEATWIDRADLAQCCLALIGDASSHRRAPFVSA